jgi:hypothetical protein
MKKVLIIISLLVGVNGFTQTQDTVNVKTFSFEKILNEAYESGYMSYDLWFFTLADVWGVNYDMIKWEWGYGDYDNYTFKSITYMYFEDNPNEGHMLKSIKMSPEEADEFFRTKNK